jgi:hexosaminidase
MEEAPAKSTVTWDETSVPEVLSKALNALSQADKRFQANADTGLHLTFAPSTAASVTPQADGGITIAYATMSEALKSVGDVLGGQVTEVVDQRALFNSFGVMIDCSRNAVMKVDTVKGWIRRLALMGYNMLMLYTEDTYELPGEPYFGYMRGRYSQAELKEIDDYADLFGIEVVPCIQALGHCEQFLRWPVYGDVRDTTTVLLAENEKTYQLIDKMLRFCRETFRSRKIHLGFDEAHDLGCGKYLKKNPYRPKWDIYIDHLKKVTEMCTAHGLETKIFSDMFFRIGSPKGQYYDKDSSIPDSVKHAIPAEAELVYWDYEHSDQAFYEEWIDRHIDLKGEPIVATACWSYLRFWYDPGMTLPKLHACMKACQSREIKDVYITLWGDDGAYCDMDSNLAGLAYATELAFGDGNVDEASVSRRFRNICGGDYALHLRAGDICHAGVPLTETGDGEGDMDGLSYFGAYNPPAILWDDPLLGILWNQRLLTHGLEEWKKTSAQLKKLHDDLEGVSDTSCGNFPLIRQICKVVYGKIDLRLMLDTAYAARDMHALKKVCNAATALQDEIRSMSKRFREVWLERNKAFGLEVIQSRFATQLARYDEMKDRIGELVSGERATIDELDHPLPETTCPDMRLEHYFLYSSSMNLPPRI